MAVSSLQRMTVPLASDQSSSTQGLLMPKLKYRFRVMFENFGVSTPRTELTKQVVNIARPNLTFEEIALPIYNSTLKLAGRHTWADITCSVRDDASGAVSRLIGEQLQKQMDFLEMSSAASDVGTQNQAATIEMSIAYDNANQTPEGTGVGTTVGRTLGDVVTGAGQAA